VQISTIEFVSWFGCWVGILFTRSQGSLQTLCLLHSTNSTLPLSFQMMYSLFCSISAMSRFRVCDSISGVYPFGPHLRCGLTPTKGYHEFPFDNTVVWVRISCSNAPSVENDSVEAVCVWFVFWQFLEWNDLGISNWDFSTTRNYFGFITDAYNHRGNVILMTRGWHFVCPMSMRKIGNLTQASYELACLKTYYVLRLLCVCPRSIQC